MTTSTEQTMFRLDREDARRVERLTAQRAATDTELALIFERALRAEIGPSGERIVGGHGVGSIYITSSHGCGIYDVADETCSVIPCSEVHEGPGTHVVHLP